MADEYDITKAFARIEDELIASIIRNMDRHRAEETEEGFEWSAWQVEQLKNLDRYKRENQKKYKKQFQDINKQIKVLIGEMRDRGNMEQEIRILEGIKKGYTPKRVQKGVSGKFFEVNDRKLEALQQATTSDMQKAEVAILRRANDAYRKAIYSAQVYANAGAGTYEKVVDMAVRDMAANGLKCVEYANGARHTLPDYADMAIRTASKRAYLQGEGEKRKEWGISTVIMAKRGNPCPKCLPFVGKVLIDDVWSGGPSDGIDPRTGKKYPLMSYAISKGLYHPRCRDSHTTYFPGISTADDTWTKEELEEIGMQNKLEARQQYAERQEEKYERLAEYSLDSENKEEYARKAEEWKKQHPPGWRRQFMRQQEEKTWRGEYAEVKKKENIVIERLDILTKESKEWESKYFESFDENGIANEEYAEKFLSYEPEIDNLTNQLEKIQNEKRAYVKKCVEETEKSMIESGMAENVKLSEKMTVESMDTIKAALKEMVVDGGLPPLKGVRYSPAFVEKYGGKDVVAFYNWQDKTMYLGELLTDSEAYREHRKIAEQSFQDFHAKNIPAWKIGVEDFEKEIKGESDSLRRRYLTKMKNDTLAELATERNLVVEDAKDAIIHEYGHHLHNTVSPKENIFGAKELKSRKFADTFEWGQSHEGKVIAAKVSNYAAESPLEAFAESFVAYQKGEDIPESLKNVVEGAIKEVGGKIKPSIAKRGVSGTMKMNLQTFANVPKEKLVNYALNPTHPVGKEKARAFKSALGYTQENSEDLRQKILGLFSEDKMVLKYEGEYGKQYEQVMKITGPNGKTANVLTAWIKENDSSEPRLVTLYVTDKEGE